MSVKVSGSQRKDAPRTWDFRARLSLGVRAKHVTWEFGTQAKTDAVGLSAPNFQWKQYGVRIVTCTVIDTKGRKHVGTLKVSIQGPPAPAPTPAPAPAPTPAAHVIEFEDFAIKGDGEVPVQFRYGMVIHDTAIIGDPNAPTVYRMKPNSSKWKRNVPKQGGHQSNQMQYLWVDQATEIAHIHVQGTPQGHLYNGLRLQGLKSPHIHDVLISSIPGNAGSPPGETFGENFQRTVGLARVERVTVDGGGVGAAAMGSNSCSAEFIIDDLYVFNNPYSAAWASWQQTGKMTFNRLRTHNCKRAFNAERLAAPVIFNDPMFEYPMGGSGDFNPTYDGGYSGGTITVAFSDQAHADAFRALRGGRKLKVMTNPESIRHGLKKATVVKVTIGGVVQRQGDWVEWHGA